MRGYFPPVDDLLGLRQLRMSTRIDIKGCGLTSGILKARQIRVGQTAHSHVQNFASQEAFASPLFLHHTELLRRGAPMTALSTLSVHAFLLLEILPWSRCLHERPSHIPVRTVSRLSSTTDFLLSLLIFDRSLRSGSGQRATTDPQVRIVLEYERIRRPLLL